MPTLPPINILYKIGLNLLKKLLTRTQDVSLAVWMLSPSSPHTVREDYKCCVMIFCLRAALRNTFINFEGKVYKQIYRFAMGFPLGPTLPNAFLCFLGQIWIN